MKINVRENGGPINYGHSRDTGNTKRKLQAQEPKMMSNTHLTQ
jgi:hypothetical protein